VPLLLTAAIDEACGGERLPPPKVHELQLEAGSVMRPRSHWLSIRRAQGHQPAPVASTSRDLLAARKSSRTNAWRGRA
jgi:hypothetical protein